VDVSSIFRKKSVFQVTPENAKTQSWLTKTVWQRITHQWARNSKTPTTITVQLILWNDYLPLTGGPQMLTTVQSSIAQNFVILNITKITSFPEKLNKNRQSSAYKLSVCIECFVSFYLLCIWIWTYGFI